MERAIKLIIAVVVACLPAWPGLAQDGAGTPGATPDIPSYEEVLTGKTTIDEFVPMDFNFSIGVIGEFAVPAGPQVQIKTPLVLINPSNGDIGVYAKNFPARIIASSNNGAWVVGVAPSSSVEGSSGSRSRECAISLNMNEGDIKIIQEFPLYSKFLAYFDPDDSNIIYYCVNEPASVNSIIGHNLKTQEAVPLDFEGNRFYLYGIRSSKPLGLWVEDPFSTVSYPRLSLYDYKETKEVTSVSFPGTTSVVVQPKGDAILAMVSSGAEASIGYYLMGDSTFHQVPNLVLTHPTFRWANNSLAIIAKESTSTRDRFLWIDLATGNVRELCSGYFKISYWDISPADDALVFIVDSEKDPLLYVVPLKAQAGAINRIRLRDVANVSWIGCLKTPGGGGGWLQRLLPF